MHAQPYMSRAAGGHAQAWFKMTAGIGTVLAANHVSLVVSFVYLFLLLQLACVWTMADPEARRCMTFESAKYLPDLYFAMYHSQ